ncbi:hypothetical protein [Methanoregula formicica]|uniref:Uncharacterized protein n=1 Tax=Methanoregula formicica (strain DSM 22288 / NBRC 105244 / SMSP) TaxID=593750 RepID=L0HB92_METFS|nr:hypothetical protein [Methanoregula formicica]AGB02017.1 hypothetical protein Metfor_0963 [Methanoregula formicica SMSP]
MQQEVISLHSKAGRLVLDYGKGALLGLVLYLLLSALVFSCGLMTTPGSETPWSGPILRAVGAFFIVAYPVGDSPVHDPRCSLPWPEMKPGGAQIVGTKNLRG